MDVKAVKERYKKKMYSMPNVISLGIGPKLREGQPTGETAIKVFVSKKVEQNELATHDRVPAELDGVPTDVEVLGPSKKL